jgi:hypothetical protein
MVTKGILKCSDELLLHIFSSFDPVSLSKEPTSSRDRYSTALACRRLYRVALPLLYRDIRFDCKSLMGKDRFALETFIQTLDTHQERAAWVQSAHFSLHEDETRMWSEITNLCSTLHSVHIVVLRIAAPHPTCLEGNVIHVLPNSYANGLISMPSEKSMSKIHESQ